MNGFNNDEVKSAAWIRNTYKSEKPHSPHTRRRWREIERVNEKWNKEDEERTNEWMKKVFSKQASKRANKQTNNKNAKLVRYIWYECFVRFSFSLSLALSRSERVCLCLCAFTFVSVCCWAQFKWLNEWKPLCISNVIISVYCSLRTALCTPLRPVRVCVVHAMHSI